MISSSARVLGGHGPALRDLARPNAVLKRRLASLTWWICIGETPPWHGIGIDRAMDLWRQGFIRNQASPLLSPEDGGDFTITEDGVRAAQESRHEKS